MSLVSIHPSAPFKHVQVSSHAWFFMNHLKKHGEASAHDHNCLELAFVLKGQARHYTVSGESLCRRGDLFLIPVGAWHGYAQCRNLEIMNCMLSPALLQRELAWMAQDAEFRALLGLGEPLGCAGIRSLSVTGSGLLRLQKLLSVLHRAYERRASRTELLGHLLLLLERLRVLSVEKGMGRENVEIHASIRRGLQLLHENPAREWTLSLLASALHLNPSYLVRLFRSQTGLAPMKYLAKLRAEKAATLLLSSREGVAGIGAKVGWPDPKQFARSFHQHFGLSASRYRSQMLKPFFEKQMGEGLPGLGRD